MNTRFTLERHQHYCHRAMNDEQFANFNFPIVHHESLMAQPPNPNLEEWVTEYTLKNGDKFLVKK